MVNINNSLSAKTFKISFYTMYVMRSILMIASLFTHFETAKNAPLFKTACFDHDLIMNTDTYYLIDILKVHPSYAESSKKVHLAGSLIPILNFSIFFSDKSHQR